MQREHCDYTLDVGLCSCPAVHSCKKGRACMLGCLDVDVRRQQGLLSSLAWCMGVYIAFRHGNICVMEESRVHVSLDVFCHVSGKHWIPNVSSECGTATCCLQRWSSGHHLLSLLPPRCRLCTNLQKLQTILLQNSLLSPAKHTTHQPPEKVVYMSVKKLWPKAHRKWTLL